MAESTGAHGGETPGGTETPFRVFRNEDDWQKEVNAIEARARQMAERRAKAVTADERAKLDALEAELEQRKQRDLEQQGNYEQAKSAIEKAAEAKVAKAAERAAKLAAVLQTKITDQVKALAAAHGAYDPEDVVVRVMPRVSIDDDGTVHVSDAPGGTVQDGISLEQAVSDLLTSKPHLAKPTGTGRGAGTTGGASLQGVASGSPAVREAHARVEEARAKLAQNPRDAHAAAAMLAAQQQLTQAQAK